MSDELTIQELVAEFPGYTPSAIQQAIHRGFLEGRKDGRTWLLPALETRLILSSKKPGEHWVKSRPRLGKRKDKTNLTADSISNQLNDSYVIGWSDVL